MAVWLADVLSTSATAAAAPHRDITDAGASLRRGGRLGDGPPMRPATSRAWKLDHLQVDYAAAASYHKYVNSAPAGLGFSPVELNATRSTTLLRAPPGGWRCHHPGVASRHAIRLLAWAPRGKAGRCLNPPIRHGPGPHLAPAFDRRRTAAAAAACSFASPATSTPAQPGRRPARRPLQPSPLESRLVRRADERDPPPTCEVVHRAGSSRILFCGPTIARPNIIRIASAPLSEHVPPTACGPRLALDNELCRSASTAAARLLELRGTSRRPPCRREGPGPSSSASPARRFGERKPVTDPHVALPAPAPQSSS